MELLLIEDYPAVGYVGQTVNVKSGYGRNFLIPKGYAVEVGSRRGKYHKHLLAGIEAKRTRLKSEAESLGEKVGNEVLEFELKVGSQGKSFGAISGKDVFEKLNAQGDYNFQRKQVRLPEPIKAGGEYVVSVQLHSEVTVEVKISVTTVVQEEKTPEEGKKRRRKPRAEADGAEESSEELLAADEAAAAEGSAEEQSSEDAVPSDSEEDTPVEA